MKKQNRGVKKLLLNKEKVKDLTKVQDDQLNQVQGGFYNLGGSDGCQSRTTSA